MIRFRQFGRTCQLRLENGEDLENALSLDQSLWMATSAPVSDFRCDPAFTALLDASGTGRITSTDVKKAIGWILTVLGNRDGIADGREDIRLDALQPGLPEAAAIVSSARYVLKTQGRESDPGISLAQVRRFLGELKAQPLNGDGIIVPDASAESDLQVFLSDAVSCIGGVSDASGKAGVGEQQLGAFQAAIVGQLEWRAIGDAARRDEISELYPLGDKSESALALLMEHERQIDAFFALCRARRFDPRATECFTAPPSSGETFTATCTESVSARLALLPAAMVSGDASLPLRGETVNPLYRDWLAALRNTVIDPLLGGGLEALSEEDWIRVKGALAPLRGHLLSRKGVEVAPLTTETLERYRDGDLFERAAKLIEKDRAVADVRSGVMVLEKLLLFQSHMFRFVNNFISFSELYTADRRAMFETGSAVIDGRWFNLALRVHDLKAHEEVAKASGIFTIYLEVGGDKDAGTFTVALPATSGSKGNLRVGKRGVFFDTSGGDSDARVIQVIDSPISMREAVVAPFVRLWQFIVGKLEAISSSSEQGLQKTTDSLMRSPPVGGQPAAFGIPGGPAGILVGLSVSAAAMGSALAFITKTFAELSWGQVAGGLGAAILVVLIPTSLVAFLKLRRQDLSALLEGCGWAINSRMHLSGTQRRQFTRRAPYPAGSVGVPRHGFIAVIVAVLLGVLAAGVPLLRAIGEWRQARCGPTGEKPVPTALTNAVQAELRSVP